jgi:hypothetical protein
MIEILIIYLLGCVFTIIFFIVYSMRNSPYSLSLIYIILIGLLWPLVWAAIGIDYLIDRFKT